MQHVCHGDSDALAATLGRGAQTVACSLNLHFIRNKA
jgi:hypothetical protein